MSGWDRLDPHVDVGAYVLGALDEHDMDRFERHLATCGRCSVMLDEFSALLPVLAELGQAGIPEPPGEAMLQRLLDEVATERRARRRRRWLTVAAAAVLIAAGPSAAVIAMQDNGPPPPPRAVAVHRTVSDPHTGVAATIDLTPKNWGTQIELRLSDIYGPRRCRLVAVGRDGTQETVANWYVPERGYGTDERPKPLTVSGASGMQVSALARFDVVTTSGQYLVSVPV